MMTIQKLCISKPISFKLLQKHLVATPVSHNHLHLSDYGTLYGFFLLMCHLIWHAGSRSGAGASKAQTATLLCLFPFLMQDYWYMISDTYLLNKNYQSRNVTNQVSNDASTITVGNNGNVFGVCTLDNEIAPDVRCMRLRTLVLLNTAIIYQQH